MSKNITPVTVSDLPESPTYGTLLYCPRCGEEYSANKGDYFWLPDDHVFECCKVNGLCGLMELVTKRTVYVAAEVN